MIIPASKFVPVRKLAGVSSSSAPYTVDNVFNWTLFDAYLVEFHRLVPGSTGAFRWIGRTSAPADAGSVHDHAGYTNLAGTLASVNARVASSVTYGSNVDTAGYGASGTILLASDGTARAFHKTNVAFEIAAGSTVGGCESSGHIGAALAGFSLSCGGAVSLTIAELNIWGMR